MDGSVPVLLTILQDEEREFRAQAARALGDIGHADAIPALINTLDELAHPSRVVAAAKVLGQLGPKASASVPQLRELLEDDHAYARSYTGAQPEAQAIART